MSDKPDPDALIAAMLPLLGINLPEDARAQVRLHLAIAIEHAEKLLAFPLADHEEPAPVFSP